MDSTLPSAYTTRQELLADGQLTTLCLYYQTGTPGRWTAHYPLPIRPDRNSWQMGSPLPCAYTTRQELLADRLDSILPSAYTTKQEPLADGQHTTLSSAYTTRQENLGHRQHITMNTYIDPSL